MIRLIRDEGGGNAIEMAIVLMVVVILTLGSTDLALALWQWSVTEKATQMGARVAAVSDVVAPQLAGYSGPATGYDFGTPCWDSANSKDICAASVASPVLCTSTSCAGQTPSATAFATILAAMQEINPLIKAENVEVEYTLNGLGFVGRPGGLPMDVTVRVTGMSFDLIALDALAGLPGALPMPAFTATLVGEDYDTSY